MREMTLPESGPKRKLLDAAERLFAERGMDAVSIRDITDVAKTNVAAVNYHFGSREALMSWVMARVVVPIHEERLARLDGLERKWSGKAVPVEEIIDAIAKPVAGQARKSGLSEPQYYKLVGRIFAQQADGLPKEIEAQLVHENDRFKRAFAKALPSVGEDELGWRMHFMRGGLIHLLMHQELPQRQSRGRSAEASMDAIVGRWVRFSAAGLREGVEPVTSSKKGPQELFDF